MRWIFATLVGCPLPLLSVAERDGLLKVKVLSADSVLDCLTVFSGVSVNRCTDRQQAEQAFLLNVEDFQEGRVLEIAIAADNSTCLGGGHGDLFTAKCGKDNAATGWRWSNMSSDSYGSFFLKHNFTGLCAKRVSWGWGVQMTDCPHPADIKEKYWGYNEAVYAFMWSPAAFARLVPEAELPLCSSGSDMIGQSGRVVRLRGINWYGAHMPQHVNNGLDLVSAGDIVQTAKNLGFNHIRVSYGTQQHFENPEVDQALIAANPDLRGLRSMEVMDRNIQTITDAGLLVILSNHVTTYAWCCAVDDGNSMWFNENWTEADWYESLRNISARYRHNPRVIGVDLRNEPRPDLKDKDNFKVPWWGWFDGIPHITADWKTAAQEASKSVWHGDPEALVFIEGNLGLDLQNAMSDKLYFGQDCLHSQVVYSVHDYDWFWRWMRIVLGLNTAHAVSIFQQLKEVSKVIQQKDPSQELDYDEFAYQRTTAWGYLTQQELAPVWIGELGTKQRETWWMYFISYVEANDLDWCYWPLNGYKWPRGYGPPEGRWRQKEVDADDWYGVLTQDWRKIRQLWRMWDLTPMLSQAGVREKKRTHPGKCVFDASLNVVQPSGVELGIVPVQKLEVIGIAIGSTVFLTIMVVCCCVCWCLRRRRLHGEALSQRTLSFEDGQNESMALLGALGPVQLASMPDPESENEDVAELYTEQYPEPVKFISRLRGRDDSIGTECTETGS
eukprot:TRINITY_DN15046_c0_g1_i2.p1 TRINITY_DN15046_c0_g1~~TRINITY_DN15046_c0_g1_i2.p1  ORF type:complete len:726 (-),score=120.78 TRINITY_DN15046_c0_g1_i2:239-2416(-)